MADSGLPLTPLSPSLLSQLALEYGGTPAIPAVQRSQYLADALHAMSGAGQDIKSPLALGSNLLAEAILRYGQNRENKALLNQIGASQTNLAADAQRGIYAPDAAPGSQPPAGFSGSEPPAAVPAGTPPPASPQGNPGLAAALTGDQFFNDFWVPHEGKLNPHDANGAADYYGINAKANGLTGPISRDQARGIFDTSYFGKAVTPDMSPGLAAMAADTYGMNPSWERRAMAAAGGDPAKFMAERQRLEAADLAANPAVRPYAKAWANRDRDLQQYASGLGFGQNGTANTSSGAQASPSPQPIQVSTGPDPSIASVGAQGPSGASPFRVAPAASPPGSPAGLQAPAPGLSGIGPGAGSPGPPTGPYATPQEAAFIRAGLSHPPGSMQYQAALAKAQEIQQRRMTPMTLQPGYTYGPDGRAMPIPGMEYRTTSQGPAGGFQTGPNGQVSAFSNPNVGPLPAGTAAGYGPNGQAQIAPIQGGGPQPLTPQQRQAYGISPNDHSIYSVDANGKVEKVADAPFNYQQAAGLVGDLTKSTQFEKASHATDMYRAAVQASQRAGGIPDAELVDFAAQEMSGGVARQFNQKMIAEGQGAWARLQQFGPELISGQKLSPGARQALLQSMRDYATEAQGTFGGFAKSSAAIAGMGGYDITPFTAPLMRDLPPVPDMGTIPNGAAPIAPAAAPQPPANPGQVDAAAAAAELQRRGYVLRNGQWTKP